MALGQNLFESIQRSTKTAGAPSLKTCVFLSHQKEDKKEAAAVAKALLANGVDIYFDEDDEVLALARIRGDDAAMVKCIEIGLDNCTHLLGIITPRSKTSWWIPYEIGGATGRGRDCAHLIDKRASNLPSYIKVATLVADKEDLMNWVRPIQRPSSRFLSGLLKEAMAMESLNAYLPEHRSEADIGFIDHS